MKIQGTRQTAKTASEPADDVRRPAAARGEAGEREDEQRGDRDGAQSARRARGRAENRSAVPWSWPAYCSNPRSRSAAPGSTEAVSPITGQQPREEDAGGERRAPRARARRPARRCRSQSQRTSEEPGERQPEEERVCRVDDRERERGGGRRGEERRSRPPRRLEARARAPRGRAAAARPSREARAP